MTGLTGIRVAKWEVGGNPLTTGKTSFACIASALALLCVSESHGAAYQFLCCPSEHQIQQTVFASSMAWLASAQLNNIMGQGMIVREQQQQKHIPPICLMLALASFITLWCLNPTKNGSSTPLIYTTEHRLQLHMIIEGRRNMHLYSCSCFFGLVNKERPCCPQSSFYQLPKNRVVKSFPVTPGVMTAKRCLGHYYIPHGLGSLN